MNSLNKVFIIGNVTRDPEVKTTTQGANVSTFSVATNLRWTTQAGERKESTEFHSVVAWRRLAEICGQYLKKGSKVFVEGRLQTRSWDDAQGQKHWRTEVVAENMIILDRLPARAGAVENGSVVEDVVPAANEEAAVEDIPF